MVWLVERDEMHDVVETAGDVARRARVQGVSRRFHEDNINCQQCVRQPADFSDGLPPKPASECGAHSPSSCHLLAGQGLVPQREREPVREPGRASRH